MSARVPKTIRKPESYDAVLAVLGTGKTWLSTAEVARSAYGNNFQTANRAANRVLQVLFAKGLVEKDVRSERRPWGAGSGGAMFGGWTHLQPVAYWRRKEN